MEDVFDDEDPDFEDDLLEHGFFFLDDEPESEDGSDSSDSGDEEQMKMSLTDSQMKWKSSILMPSSLKPRLWQ